MPFDIHSTNTINSYFMFQGKQNMPPQNMPLWHIVYF